MGVTVKQESLAACTLAAMTELARRERKRLATSAAVRRAALELFLDRGFDAVSVEEVAERADVSPSTVYRHFPTKEDLVLADLAERQEQFLHLLDAQPAHSDLGEALVEATLEWVPTGEDEALLRQEAALIMATDALYSAMHAMVARWEGPICLRLATRCGRPANDLELRQLTALFCASVRIIIREWALDDRGRTLRDFGLPAMDALRHLPAASWR